MKRPNLVILELEDLPDTHTATALYIERLEVENEALKGMLHQVRRAIEEIEDADDYLALQAALRGEPSK